MWGKTASFPENGPGAPWGGLAGAGRKGDASDRTILDSWRRREESR